MRRVSLSPWNLKLNKNMVSCQEALSSLEIKTGKTISAAHVLSAVDANTEEKVIISKDDTSDEFCKLSRNFPDIKGGRRAFQSEE